jgi:GNAT superfamily N-acetyltransferase
VTGEVFAIYADPDAWGMGTGRTLMGTAVAELARLGYADAILWYWTPTTDQGANKVIGRTTFHKGNCRLWSPPEVR